MLARKEANASSCTYLVKIGYLYAAFTSNTVSVRRETTACISILSLMRYPVFYHLAWVEAKSRSIVHILKEDSARMAWKVVTFFILMIMEKVHKPKYVAITYLVFVPKALIANALTSRI